MVYNCHAALSFLKNFEIYEFSLISGCIRLYLKDSDKINFDELRIIRCDVLMVEGVGEEERDGDGNEGEERRRGALSSVRPFDTFSLCTTLDLIC